ncbi:hypothetical protein BGZ98_000669 [Dissophora globulifera]|nr:hypothetical protein BGZ98_000669 [Dissophora globulifera]
MQATNPMSDNIHTDNDTILQLRQELAVLQSLVTAQLRGSRILIVPDDLKEAMPAISGMNFFKEPADAADDTIFTDDVMFPKNPEQQYTAPIQDRLAFITRPVDDFAVDAFSSIEDPDIRQSIFDFTQIVRSQLAITARQITKMRGDNYLSGKGLKPAPDKAKETTISKEDITSQIRAAESFAAASTPPKSVQTGNNQFGRDKYTRSYRGDFFGRSQHQQQQFPQQQSRQHQSGYLPQVQVPSRYPSKGYDGNYNGHQGRYFQRDRRGRDAAEPEDSRGTLTAFPTRSTTTNRRRVGALGDRRTFSDSLPQDPSENAVRASHLPALQGGGTGVADIKNED